MSNKIQYQNLQTLVNLYYKLATLSPRHFDNPSAVSILKLAFKRTRSIRSMLFSPAGKCLRAMGTYGSFGSSRVRQTYPDELYFYLYAQKFS